MSMNQFVKPNFRSEASHIDPVEVNEDDFQDFSIDREYLKTDEKTLITKSEYTLPRTIPFKEYPQMILSISPNLDKRITDALINLFEVMGEGLITYDKNEVENFSFVLPKTIFDESWNNFSVLKRRQEKDDVFDENFNMKVRKLSIKQISQIWKTGSFTSSSNIEDRHYTWKMSSWIILGRKNLINFLFDCWAFSIKQFYEFPKRITQKKEITTFFLPDIKSGIISIYNSFRNLFSLFIGFPIRLKININYFDLKEKILKNHMQDILKNEEVNKAFYHYIENEANQNELREIEARFIEIWRKRKDSIRTQLPEDEDYFIHIQEAYYTNFFQFIKDNDSKSLTKEIKEHLINTIKAASIINRTYEIRKYEMDKKNYEFTINLKKKHGLLKKVEEWKSSKIETFEKNSKQDFRNRLFKTVMDEKTFNELDFKGFRILFEKFYFLFINFKKSFQDQMAIEKKRVQNDNSKNNFKIIKFFKYYYPPGKIIFKENGYHLQEYREITIKVDHFFWRITVLITRYFVFSNNAALFLLYNALSGPFSLKALFSVSGFYLNYEIDFVTGQKKNFTDKTESVMSAFQNVWRSIKKSRNDFESAPDTGIFGKKFTRICNLLENYVFKFFFIGIIICLFFFPLFILINSVLSIILSLTSYIWMIFMMIFVWLGNILFYDIDNENKQEEEKNSNAHSEFPFFLEIFVTFLLFGIIQIMLSFFFIFLIHPILILSSFCFGIISYLLRTFYDVLLLVVVFALGREPKTDSFLAWKISGPGISEDYFNQIDIDEVLILIRVYMEKYELSLFKKKMIRIINEPLDKLINLHSNVFEKSIKISGPSKPKDLVEMTNKIHDRLNFQINERNRFYLKFPKNVRLTEEELSDALTNGEKLINNFIEKQNIKEIFHDFKLKNHDWKNLTKCVLASIFGKEILEPVEELEKRAKLKTMKSNNFEQILDILKGEGGDSYKHLVLKKKKAKKIDYNFTPSYINIEKLIKVENYFSDYVNCLFVCTNTNELKEIQLKESENL